MSYRVNGRNLSVGRLMVRGKEADKRLKYIHVGPKGTSVITPELAARVSLPDYCASTEVAALIPQGELDALPRVVGDDTVVLPEGRPAVTQPDYVVPQIDKCFPAPEHQTATFTCNAELLKKLLTVACEVSRDSQKLIRLRLCEDFNALRIDAYRQPGHQEFIAVLKGMDYEGNYIPGELPTNAPKVEKKPVQRALGLKVNVGRRFRGEGE